jgi:glutamyl-tRNA synthetase
MASLNTTMRDPVIFRIIAHTHYRQGDKYKVWPTYDINTPVVDSLEGITDVLRDKNWEMRDELYNKVLSLIGLRKPAIRSIARVGIVGNLTSKRKTNALIEEGKISGYDDPRLITISGLRRRGIQPQAIKNFVMRFGMSKSKQEVKMEMLLAENRMVIDDIARRMFMVQDPVELKVSGIPREYGKVKLKLHPSKDLGYRECDVSDRFLISGSDAETLDEGDVFRLKDLFNVRVEKVGERISAKFDGNESIDASKFQWVNAGKAVKCKIVHIDDLLVNEEFNPESMTVSEGYAEAYVDNLKQNEIIQFERVGFFKLDDFKEKSFIAL